MGSPSSQKMTPGRVNVITGEVKIPLGDVTPEEWLDILLVVICRCKPYLEHLSGCMPLHRWLNNENGLPGFFTIPLATRLKDLWTCGCPADEYLRKKLVRLANVSDYKEKSTKFSSAYLLMLDENGNLFTLDICYENKPHQTKIYSYSVNLSTLKPSEALEFIRKRHIEVWSIIDSLWIATRESITVRQRHLEGLTRLAERLDGMKNRLEMPA